MQDLTLTDSNCVSDISEMSEPSKRSFDFKGKNFFFFLVINPRLDFMTRILRECTTSDSNVQELICRPLL